MIAGMRDKINLSLALSLSRPHCREDGGKERIKASELCSFFSSAFPAMGARKRKSKSMN
jgi:hypothetical protein